MSNFLKTNLSDTINVIKTNTKQEISEILKYAKTSAAWRRSIRSL